MLPRQTMQTKQQREHSHTSTCNPQPRLIPLCPFRETLEEMIALRRLKRATGGIELDRLNAGEKKRRSKQESNRDANGEVVLADGQVEGTQGGLLQRGKDRIKDEPEP